MSDARPVIYDMTRLVTRVTTDTPNGIDRVDLTLARHFAFRPTARVHALIETIAGPRLVPAAVARAIVTGIEAWWQETDKETGKEAGKEGEPETAAAYGRLYEQVVARLTGADGGGGRLVCRVSGRGRAALRAIWNHGLCRGASPVREAPRGAAYINASHFPLEYGWHLRWLKAREDVAPVFFIHDLLPIEWPQLFWPREPERHRRRLAHIHEIKGRAIVASAAVALAVKRDFEARGYAIPILQAALPAADIFRAPPRPDPRLEAVRDTRPYFLVCGSIEPRKNHVLLLHIWRQLVQEQGEAAPALVIAGKRGWNSESAVDLLERSRALQGRVIEVAGLPTRALRRLMDSAAAVLAPSLAEGFGLPVAEAIAAGAPVIAADIDAFREQAQAAGAGADVTLIDPIDGVGWMAAIRARAGGRERASGGFAVPLAAFTEKIERFLDA